MEKLAPVDHEIHAVLRGRWSPRAFAPRPVEAQKLKSLFEAARWSPSASNLQPWTFLVATADDPAAHARFVETLVGRNATWAKDAPVLVLAVAQTRIAGTPDRANPWAQYDLGQAVAHLSVQASALGLYLHQMAGFDGDKARELLGIPEGFHPVAMIAIGYYGDLEALPEELKEREKSPRQRKPQAEFVYAGQWGETLVLP